MHAPEIRNGGWLALVEIRNGGWWFVAQFAQSALATKGPPTAQPTAQLFCHTFIFTSATSVITGGMRLIVLLPLGAHKVVLPKVPSGIGTFKLSVVRQLPGTCDHRQFKWEIFDKDFEPAEWVILVESHLQGFEEQERIRLCPLQEQLAEDPAPQAAAHQPKKRGPSLSPLCFN